MLVIILCYYDSAFTHIDNRRQRHDRDVPVRQFVSPALERLLDYGGDAHQRGPGGLHDAGQRVDGAARRQKVVDDEDAVAGREELRRHHQQHLAALGVAGCRVDVDRLAHGDGLVLAGVDDGQVAQRPPGHRRRDDAAHLGRQDARRPRGGELRGDGLARGLHQQRVDLVVEEAVDLQDAAAEILALAADAIFEELHDSSGEGGMTPA